MAQTTEQIRNAQTDMLVRFYNMISGHSFRVSNAENRKATETLLGAANNDAGKAKFAIKSFLSEKAENKDLDLVTGMMLASKLFEKKEEEKKEEPKPQTTNTDAQKINDGLNLMQQAVVNLIANMNQQTIEDRTMAGIKNTIDNYIAKTYGPIEKKVTLTIDGKKKDLEGVQHEKFETVLKFVANDEPVFLTGPAGSGKNVLCKQVADVLDIPFYFSNAVTQEYKLTGFTDANGNYQETQFYKAFKDGGLFMLDEIDASIPEVLVILNAAIANRYFDFPAPVGFVKANKNFRVIAAGNTFGTGADYDYVGRNQLDAASLDRFAMVKIDYSPAIEQNVAMGNTELLNFCRGFRKAADKAGIKALVSYRAIGRMAKMLQIMDDADCLNSCLIKGMEVDDLNIIIKELPADNKYTMVAKHIAAQMQR